MDEGCLKRDELSFSLHCTMSMLQAGLVRETNLETRMIWLRRTKKECASWAKKGGQSSTDTLQLWKLSGLLMFYMKHKETIEVQERAFGQYISVQSNW